MYGAIDVGTNTVRLLLAEVRTGKLQPLLYHRKITRLGGGLTPDQGLAPEAMERTLSFLEEISQILRRRKVHNIRAVGTAALRTAANGPRFLEKVRSTTGLQIEVIDGEQEARLCALGVLAALEPRPRRCLIFDIGGGSTEFIIHADGRLPFHRSYPIGVVTLSEKFPSPERQQERIDEVLDALLADLSEAGHRRQVSAPDTLLVGTAGTVTTLAALHLGMTEYDWRRVNNLVLPRPDLEAMLARLEGLSIEARETLPGMEKGRGDLIVPGLRFVLNLLARTGKEQLTVSDFGLLEGIVPGLAGTGPDR